MNFFRRQDVMQGVALTRVSLPSGTFDALQGALTRDRRYLDPETANGANKRVRLWRDDLPSEPEVGQICTLEGAEYRISSVRVWLDFVVLELEAKYGRGA